MPLKRTAIGSCGQACLSRRVLEQKTLRALDTVSHIAVVPAAMPACSSLIPLLVKVDNGSQHTATAHPVHFLL